MTKFENMSVDRGRPQKDTIFWFWSFERDKSEDPILAFWGAQNLLPSIETQENTILLKKIFEKL